jgi:hypothetical protein
VTVCDVVSDIDCIASEEEDNEDDGIREGVFVMLPVLDCERISVTVMEEVSVRRFENDEELLAPNDSETDGEGILERERVEAGVFDLEHRKPAHDAVELMEGVQERDGRLGEFVNDDETLEPRETVRVRDSDLDKEGVRVWAIEPIMAKPHIKTLINIYKIFNTTYCTYKFITIRFPIHIIWIMKIKTPYII